MSGTKRVDGNSATRVYWCVGGTFGTGHTFTATTTGTYPTILVEAFSNTGVVIFDQESGAAATGVTSIQPGSLTPLSVNALVVAGVDYFQGTSASINGGFTADTLDTVPGGGVSGLMAYLIQTAAVAANPTSSWTGSNPASAALATFVVSDSAIVPLVSTGAGSTNDNDVTSPGVDTTTAKLIVLGVSHDYVGSDYTPTDSKSNTWTPLTARSNFTANRLRLWYCVNPTTDAAHTFSLTATGHKPSIAVQAFSVAAGGFDAETGAASTQPGSITPAENWEVLITCGSNGATGGGSSQSITSPFTQSANLLGGTHAQALSMAYSIQATATARNPIWTGGDVSVMAAFKAG